MKTKWEDKNVWGFQTRNWQNLPREEMDLAMENESLRKTESLLIAQNNAIRTNYLKPEIDT